MEHNTEPRNKFTHVRLLIFYEVLKTHNGEMSLQQLVLGKTGYQHTTESNWTPTVNHTQKLMQNGVKTST